jgi:hypothetical protein
MTDKPTEFPEVRRYAAEDSFGLARGIAEAREGMEAKAGKKKRAKTLPA